MSQLESLEALYRDLVLDHCRSPRNREPIEQPHASASLLNPLCGDEITVEVLLSGTRIERISARARGCSIVVAAASVMGEVVRELDAAAANELGHGLERLLQGGSPADTLEDERLRAFARVATLRPRHRCVLLPWEALSAALGD